MGMIVAARIECGKISWHGLITTLRHYVARYFHLCLLTNHTV